MQVVAIVYVQRTEPINEGEGGQQVWRKPWGGRQGRKGKESLGSGRSVGVGGERVPGGGKAERKCQGGGREVGREAQLVEREGRATKWRIERVAE